MHQSFLQSEEWEEFQKQLGTNPFRINGKLVEKLPLLLGQSYLYCPRAYFESAEELHDFYFKAQEKAKELQAFFIRIEPVVSEKINIDSFEMRKVSERQPGQTLMLDLSRDVNKILESTKSKTRYNIRLAEKKGVSVKFSTKKEDLQDFINLADITAKRDKIRFRDNTYYETMLESLSKYNMIKIYSAIYKNKVIASAITLNYKNTFTYLYGASSDQDRNVMAPYLLQWKMINDAKKEGYSWYDFWGVAPLQKVEGKFEIKNSEHSWSGITKFKLGFVPNETNGKYIKYPGCYEISVGKKRYFLYKMFRS